MAFPAGGGGTGIGNGEETLHTIAASGASQALAFGNGATQQITLTADCTFTLSGFVSGKACYLTLKLIQDATGSRLVTWPTITWVGTGTAPTLQTAAGAVDSVVLFSEDGGTTVYGVAQTSASGLASGTSFPGSPSDGDLFYRTDRRILYEYDAASTHWLSVDRKYWGPSPGQALPASGTATNYDFWPVGEDVYIEEWTSASYIPSGTNNASNYWTVTLSKTTSGASPASTTLGTFTTSADGNSLLTHKISVGLVVAAAAYAWIALALTKTGTPGAWYGGTVLVVRSVG